MKTNSWLVKGGLVLGMLVATGALAQVNTGTVPVPAPPAAPAAVPMVVDPPVPATTNAPATKPVVKHHPKKHVVKKAAATKTVAKSVSKTAKAAAVTETNAAPLTVTLVPGEAEVAAAHVNVRGQAGLKGEVITHLQKGDKVTVLAEINLDKHKADEPAQWAKISLPTETKVWVDAKFVDAATKAVKAKKLNLRGGPGENFSVLGVLEAGATVNPVNTKGNWMQIDTPTNAYAFVAASLLTQSAMPAVTPTPVTPAVVENTTPVTPAAPPVVTTTNTLTETPAIVATPATPAADTNAAPAVAVANTNTPATTNIAAVIASEQAAAAAAAAAATNAAAVTDTNPPPPRIVTHEGVVHGVRSIIAPTYYELDDAVTGKEINYLYTTTTNLDLARYNKLHIIVTGEEGLAARWKDTPVLTIQRIQVVE